MHMLRIILILTSVSTAGYLNVTPASAGVITQSVAFDGGFGTTTTLALDKFDASLGALSQIELAYDVLGYGQYFLRNTITPVSLFETFDLSSTITFDSYLEGPLSGQASAMFLGQLFGLSGVQGIGIGFLQGQGSTLISDPAAFDPFIAAGVNDDLEISMSTTPISVPFTVLASFTQLSGNLTLTYTYDEPAAAQLPLANNATVPEPSSLAIFGIGAIAIAGVRRRRTNRR